MEYDSTNISSIHRIFVTLLKFIEKLQLQGLSNHYVLISRLKGLPVLYMDAVANLIEEPDVQMWNIGNMTISSCNWWSSPRNLLNISSNIRAIDSLDESLNKTIIFLTKTFLPGSWITFWQGRESIYLFPTCKYWTQCLISSILVSYDDLPNFLMISYQLDLILVMITYHKINHIFQNWKKTTCVISVILKLLVKFTFYSLLNFFSGAYTF